MEEGGPKIKKKKKKGGKKKKKKKKRKGLWRSHRPRGGKNQCPRETSAGFLSDPDVLIGKRTVFRGTAQVLQTRGSIRQRGCYGRQRRRPALCGDEEELEGGLLSFIVYTKETFLLKKDTLLPERRRSI